MGIGDKMRELRRRDDKTQRELADYLGLSQQAYNHYERGRRKPDTETVQKLAAYYGVTTDYLLGREMPPNVVAVSDMPRRRVPLIGSVAAGQPIFAAEEWGEFAPEPDADYALRVEGDSMEPDYIDGDIVYIKQASDVEDGQTAIVLVDDEATLKQVYHLRDGLLLVSENPAYKPMRVTCEFDTVRILGVPVGFVRLYE